MRCLCIIPSCFSHQIANDDEIVEFFSSDLEYISAAKAELQLWRAHFKGQEQLPETPQSALKHATPMLFPNIRKMLICIMVLPVTSCEAERSFSVLRRIKTYLRTTMTQDRLNSLSLLSIHNSSQYIPSTAEIKSTFLQKHHCIMESKTL